MNDLIAVTAGWGVIAVGVAGLFLFGRDPKADEHDLADYHEPAPVNDARRALAPTPQLCSSPDCPACADDDLPPAPAGMNAGSPLYAGMLFDTWHPEDPAEVAARFLREVGEDARAKAGIRPTAEQTPAHRQVAGWVGVPGECGVECECGVWFDGFDTIAEAVTVLDRHIAFETLTARDMTGAFPVVRAA